jgi:hypothetical protein
LKRDRESAVSTAGDNEFQQSMDLLKKVEKNFAEPLLGLSKIGKSILKGGSIERLKKWFQARGVTLFRILQ